MQSRTGKEAGGRAHQAAEAASDAWLLQGGKAEAWLLMGSNVEGEGPPERRSRGGNQQAQLVGGPSRPEC